MFLEKVHHPERVLNPLLHAAETDCRRCHVCGETDRDVIEFIMATLPRLGLYPFEAHRESTGFIFNRVWAAVKRESLEVVAEGVSTPQELDRMFEINTGSAVGPFRMMDQGFEQSSFGEMTFAGAWQQRSSVLPPALKHVLRDALVGHFATGWQRTLPANQATVIAYTTPKPDYTLRVTIEYEDETSYQWRRTNTSQPKRIG
ncbi:MAG TPA: 3-hydroxyacyl-CoA dehydrogenase family protein [Mycobacterium sp.]|nr:3-hydroxyacyl-CoA dehydrogenase family protein [Mycobacterium sp.]